MKSDHFSVESSLVQDKNESRKWQASLRVKHQPDAITNAAYAFSLELIGFFEVSKEFPDDTKERLVRTNAPTILYGIAREIIKTLTTSGPHPGILIPSISFYEQAAQTKQMTAANPV